MSQFSPETILSGRYKIIHSLMGDPSIDRYRAVDMQSGAEVEILTPTARNVLNAQLRSQFLNTHQQNKEKQAGYLTCLDSFLEGAVPIAVYPNVRSLLPQTISLSPEQTLGLLHCISPLLHRLNEPLRYSNLIITEQGELRYRPRGYTAQGNRILGHPLEDPVSDRGNPFALSMIVYQALHSLPKWRKKQEQIEWLSHAVRLQIDASENSAVLEQHFETLFSGAAPQIDAHSSFTLDIPRELPLKTKKETTTVVNQTEELRRTATKNIRVDIPYPEWVIFLSPPLGEQNAKVLAAALQLDPQALAKQLEKGPTPICGASTKSDAEKRKQTMSEMGLRVEIKQGSLLTPMFIGTEIGSFLLTVGLFVFSPLLGLAAMALSMVLTFVLVMSRANNQRRFKEVQAIKTHTPLETALQKARTKIFQSELPQIAKSDYYEMIDEIEALGREKGQEEYCLELVGQINPVMQEELSTAKRPRNAEEIKKKLHTLQKMSQTLE